MGKSVCYERNALVGFIIKICRVPMIRARAFFRRNEVVKGNGNIRIQYFNLKNPPKFYG